MTEARLSLGRAAEDEAARRLECEGFSLLARNERVRYAELGIAGEIDIVAIEEGVLVFVEVKSGRLHRGNAGRDVGPERPVLAVGRQKQLRLRRLARAWLSSHSELPRFTSIRFDVIGVVMDSAGGVHDYEHIRAAF
jgi:putative endonuclease